MGCQLCNDFKSNENNKDMNLSHNLNSKIEQKKNNDISENKFTDDKKKRLI